MNDLEKQLEEELQREFDDGRLRWERSIDVYIALLEESFPFVGSQIDWEDVPDAISIVANENHVDSAYRFFIQICRQMNLVGDCILISDSSFDAALSSSIEALEGCLRTLLEYPHHLFIFDSAASWCFVFTSRGYFDFGRSPNH